MRRQDLPLAQELLEHGEVPEVGGVEERVPRAVRREHVVDVEREGAQMEADVPGCEAVRVAQVDLGHIILFDTAEYVERVGRVLALCRVYQTR